MQISSIKKVFLQCGSPYLIAGPINEADRSMDSPKHVRSHFHLKLNKLISGFKQRTGIKAKVEG
jgi:hypothetical protein